MHLNDTQIDNIKKYFQNKPIQKAFLFGSYVNGKVTKESDIDILVELDYSKPIGLQFIKMKLELQELLQKNVDLLSEQAISKYIRPNIDKHKQLIYERH